MSDSGWLVVGLGNPGPEYAHTRHNFGYRVVDELAARSGGVWRLQRARRAQVSLVRLGPAPGIPVALVKPAAFMNESGGPVAGVAKYYKTPLDRLVAVHDDLDLEFGTVRIKGGGGDGGHNGLRSLRRSLGAGDFYRVRMGIGRPPDRQDARDFVLSNLTAAERAELPVVVRLAADAVCALIHDGLEATQNRLHRPAQIYEA